MRQLLLAFSVLLPVGLTALLLVWSHRRRTSLDRRALGPVVRTATLTQTDGNGRRFFPVAISLALLPLAATALLISSRWNDIPERFPVHWGFDGKPNGWSVRSPLSVFGPLVLGAVLIGLFALMNVLTDRYSPGFAGRPTMLRVKHGALTGAAWLIALLFCATGGFPLLKDPTRWVPLFIIGCALTSLTFVIVVVYRSILIPDSVTLASRRTTEDRFWKGGLFYYNPADCAIMVPKRDGLGYTMNFGRPVAWILLGSLLLVAGVLPVLLHIASQR